MKKILIVLLAAVAITISGGCDSGEDCDCDGVRNPTSSCGSDGSDGCGSDSGGSGGGGSGSGGSGSGGSGGGGSGSGGSGSGGSGGGGGSA